MVLAMMTRFTEEGLVAEERTEPLPGGDQLVAAAYERAHDLVMRHGGAGHVHVLFSSGHLPILVTHATQGNWGNGPFMVGMNG
jgi:hypothetical protein